LLLETWLFENPHWKTGALQLPQLLAHMKVSKIVLATCVPDMVLAKAVIESRSS